MDLVPRRQVGKGGNCAWELEHTSQVRFRVQVCGHAIVFLGTLNKVGGLRGPGRQEAQKPSAEQTGPSVTPTSETPCALKCLTTSEQSLRNMLGSVYGCACVYVCACACVHTRAHGGGWVRWCEPGHLEQEISFWMLDRSLPLGCGPIMGHRLV